MSVNDTNGLEKGVDDGAAYKFHSPFLQVLGDSVRQRRGGAKVAWLIDNSPVREAPDVVVERAKLYLYLDEGIGICNTRVNLQLVSYNLRIISK